MTFLSLTLVLGFETMALTSAQPDCSLLQGTPSAQRVFTNADLDRMTACRYQTGIESEAGGAHTPATRSASPGRTKRGAKGASASNVTTTANVERHDEALEADWRAQWRAIDQKARRLKREAQQLRQEASEIPRDPKKKQPTGRRSTSLLIGRAEALEADARELEEEFQERARREGALPGWLRPRAY